MFSKPTTAPNQLPGDDSPRVHPRAANRGWVARARAAGVQGGALLSFVMLSLYANADGEAFVSQTRLANDCGVSDRTIRNHRRRWERARLLEARSRCGPRGLTLYRLAAPDLAAAGVGSYQFALTSPTPPAVGGKAAPMVSGDGGELEAPRPGAARVRPPQNRPENERRAVGADFSAQSGNGGYPDRNGPVPTKTEGERERSELSLAKSSIPVASASARAWPKSPATLAPDWTRTAATGTARGTAYAPGGAAHPAASSSPLVRALPAAASATGGPARPAPLASHLAAVRSTLEALRARSAAAQLPLRLDSQDDDSAPLLTWEGADELDGPTPQGDALGRPGAPLAIDGGPVGLAALLPGVLARARDGDDRGGG